MILNTNADVGVVIGRFQVPEFHSGHKFLLDMVAENHGEMLVFLGVSVVIGAIEDPLDYPVREQMIRDMYPHAMIASIIDTPDDKTWSEQVDREIAKIYPGRTAFLYGGRDSFINHYAGKYKTREIDSLESPSGTEVRASINSRDADTNFRRGVIYAIRNQYPRVIPTVDIAVSRRVGERVEFLMGTKHHGNGFIFPGGFVDSHDESFEAAAVRELYEETGIALSSGIESLRYLGSTTIDDWRYRGRRDSIMTSLFAAEYSFGRAIAGDDLATIDWIGADLSNIQRVAQHHRVLFRIAAAAL
jgi:bifunctional NMN adenylyltransferase/nudix hydrolase